MASPQFWAVRTSPIGCVLVFAVPPSRAAHGGWRDRGRVHKWSRLDAATNGLDVLERDVPCPFHFLPGAVGRWIFTHRGVASGVVTFETDGRWTEDFCTADFPTVIGRPDLAQGDQVSLVFDSPLAEYTPMPKNLMLTISMKRVDSETGFVEAEYGPAPFAINGLSLIDAHEVEASLVSSVVAHAQTLLAKGKAHAVAKTAADK